MPVVFGEASSAEAVAGVVLFVVSVAVREAPVMRARVLVKWPITNESETGPLPIGQAREVADVYRKANPDASVRIAVEHPKLTAHFIEDLVPRDHVISLLGSLWTEYHENEQLSEADAIARAIVLVGDKS